MQASVLPHHVGVRLNRVLPPKFSPRPVLLLCVALASPLTAFATAAQVERPPSASPGQQPRGSYWLRATGDEVNVRSRADLNARVVARLPRGTLVRGVAQKGEWHEILPPEGVYSLVSGAYIEREPGSPKGVVRVAVSNLRVRVGSLVQTVDPLREEVQTTLEDGTEVEIVGEEGGGWLRIKPPPGVHYYVSAAYTERLTDEQAHAASTGAPAAQPDASPEPARPPPPAPPRPASDELVPARPPPPRPPTDEQNTPVAAPAREPVVPIIVPNGALSDTDDDAAVRVDDVEDMRPAPVPAKSTATEPAPANPAARQTREPAAAPPGTGIDVIDIARLPAGVTPAPRPAPSTAEPARQTPDSDRPAQESAAASAAAPPTAPSAQAADRPDVRQARPAPPSTPQSTQASTRSATPAGKPPRFLAEGILQPSFSLPISPRGLRYELVHPYSKATVGYVEFGIDVKVNPTRLVGLYVGVAGEVFEEAGVNIIRVTHVTVLSMPLPKPPAARRR